MEGALAANVIEISAYILNRGFTRMSRIIVRIADLRG